MEILRSYSQIVERTKKALNIDVQNIAMLDELPDDYLEQLAKNVTISQDENDICDLAMLVFQLNNFMPALCNYTKVFLHNKNFYAILVFISKCYSTHLGDCVYISEGKSYNATERLFDRFIELMKAFEVDTKLYFPLVLDCVFNNKAQVAIWTDVALEFLQKYMAECGEELQEFFEDNEQYQMEYLSLVMQSNTQKGMQILFDSFIKNQPIKNSDYFIKKYATDACLFVDQHLPKEENERLCFIQTLAQALENEVVAKKLKAVYEKETFDGVKQFIAEKLNICEEIEIITTQQFKEDALKNVLQPQQRTLGIAFEKLPLVFIGGENANETEKTYLINVFKENNQVESLKKLVWLFDIFEKDSLANFAKTIFYKVSSFNDILQAKWAVRMFCLVCEGRFKDEVEQFLQSLKEKNRNKEAKYVENCLHSVNA